jgi:hypothetical protein
MQSTISEYLIKARQGDAARAGERDRFLLEARRIRATGRRRARPRGTFAAYRAPSKKILETIFSR